MKKKQKEEYTTCIIIPGITVLLLDVRKKAQRSTTQHRSAGLGTARHRMLVLQNYPLTHVVT